MSFLNSQSTTRPQPLWYVSNGIFLSCVSPLDPRGLSALHESGFQPCIKRLNQRSTTDNYLPFSIYSFYFSVEGGYTSIVSQGKPSAISKQREQMRRGWPAAYLLLVCGLSLRIREKAASTTSELLTSLLPQPKY